MTQEIVVRRVEIVMQMSRQLESSNGLCTKIIEEAWSTLV